MTQVSYRLTSEFVRDLQDLTQKASERLPGRSGDACVGREASAQGEVFTFSKKGSGAFCEYEGRLVPRLGSMPWKAIEAFRQRHGVESVPEAYCGEDFILGGTSCNQSLFSLQAYFDRSFDLLIPNQLGTLQEWRELPGSFIQRQEIREVGRLPAKSAPKK